MYTSCVYIYIYIYYEDAPVAVAAWAGLLKSPQGETFAANQFSIGNLTPQR